KYKDIVINKNKKTLRVVFIIPARLKSSRLKKKLLKNINGLPMIIRVAKNAEKINLGEVIVGTDSTEIYNLCTKNKIKVFMTNRDHKSGTDRIFEVYNLNKKKFDIIANLQGDLPIFSKDMITRILELFYDKSVGIGSAVCSLTKEEIRDQNIVKAKVILDKKNIGNAIDFSRRITSTENYYHHIGIYFFRPNILKKFVNLSQTKNEVDRSLEQMRALDNNLKIKLVKLSYNPPSVDTIDDLRKIRLIFKKNNF
ncbi:MAG: 3-deoxy-manno-octulosonate cytidylyltransferase, partial [Pseudomonadota bacterium]|nr:3-deoxy-manno-octulosonate cytidylyltransferase [Pseudomonadota bacterium]